MPASVSGLIVPAIDHALAVTHAAFVAQVVSYLDPEFHAVYAHREAWDTLQTTVVDALQALGP